MLQHPLPDGGESGAIYLYSHWGGGSLARVVQCALVRGRDRWTDEPYLGRILFNEMTAGSEMETQSFGVSTYLTDNEHDLLVVDAEKQTVSLQPPGGPVAKSWAFDDFVRRDLVADHLADENFACAAAPAKSAAPPPVRGALTYALFGAVALLAALALVRRWR